MSLFVAVLFFVLSPGVLVRLPVGGSKMAVAAFHAVVFAVVYGLVHKTVWQMLYTEGFYPPPPPKPSANEERNCSRQANLCYNAEMCSKAGYKWSVGKNPSSGSCLN